MAPSPTEPSDAAEYARHHAGEHDATLTPAERDLLGRVIARRIERGAKLDTIARAAATALWNLDPQRIRRLARDEVMRAFAWESLRALRASGATTIALSYARDACPTCVAAAGSYPIDHVPPIPIAGCSHPSGCRCGYIAQANDTAAASPAGPATASDPAAVGQSIEQSAAEQRPWYRKRPPRPHGPRWTEEQRAARHPTAPRRPAASSRPSDRPAAARRAATPPRPAKAPFAKAPPRPARQRRPERPPRDSQ